MASQSPIDLEIKVIILKDVGQNPVKTPYSPINFNRRVKQVIKFSFLNQ